MMCRILLASSNQPPRRLSNIGPDFQPRNEMETDKVVTTSGTATASNNDIEVDTTNPPGGAIGNKKRRRRRRRKPRYGNTNLQLPTDFQPTDNTVVCGRSRQSFDSEGNKRLRHLVKTYVDDYVKAKDKQEKSDILSNIVQVVRRRSPEGAFVKQIDGQWFEVGDAYAREKVGAQFREYLHTQYRSSVKSKMERKRKRKEAQQKKEEPALGELSAARLERLSSSDSSGSTGSSSSSSSFTSAGSHLEEASSRLLGDSDATMTTIANIGMTVDTLPEAEIKPPARNTIQGATSSTGRINLLDGAGLPADSFLTEFEIPFPEPIIDQSSRMLSAREDDLLMRIHHAHDSILVAPVANALITGSAVTGSTNAADYSEIRIDEPFIDDIISDLARTPTDEPALPLPLPLPQQPQQQANHTFSFFDVDDQSQVMFDGNGMIEDE